MPDRGALSEGVVKFRYTWKREPLRVPVLLLLRLGLWRRRLRRRGLLGATPEGVGYGNISLRWGGGFLVTGSGTGGLLRLGARHYALVDAADPEANWLSCRGLACASSESLSHAAVYRALSWAGAVIHVHSSLMWRRFLGRLPTTPEEAGYGTPEMARALSRLLQGCTSRSGALVMAGHEDGLLFFGGSLGETAKLVLRLHEEAGRTSSAPEGAPPELPLDTMAPPWHHRLMDEKLNARIGELKIVPVIKLDRVADAVPLGKALLEGGLPIVEITFRTEAAEEAIRTLASQLPDLLIGAGTVLTIEQVQRALKAGARFIVTPGFNPRVVDYCVKRRIPIYPGINNPMGVEAALERGLKVLKFFPAEASGGIKMIQALAAPYVGVKYIPTGGVSPANLAAYLKEPAVYAVGGTWIARSDAIAAGKFDEITRLAKEAVAIARGQ